MQSGPCASWVSLHPILPLLALPTPARPEEQRWPAAATCTVTLGKPWVTGSSSANQGVRGAAAQELPMEMYRWEDGLALQARQAESRCQ